MIRKSRAIYAFGLAALGLSTIAPAAMISGQGTWETTLQGRDLDGNLATVEAYYDTTQNITWLADANYAQTTGYDADGQMTWNNATTWVTQLNIGGVTGWRLPTTVDVGNDGETEANFYQGIDYGFNITTHSEMSHLFYVTLGDLAYYDTSGGGPFPDRGLTNSGPFAIDSSFAYWSATRFTQTPGRGWWTFNFFSGFQSSDSGLFENQAWAVHSGDVGVPAVPVPAAVWLLLSGIASLAGLSKRPKALQARG
jgi:hypothetical protein